MAQTTVAAAPIADRAQAAAESREIHLAACRYRRQGLVCSTCTSLTERAAKLQCAAVAQQPAEQAAPITTSASQEASAHLHLSRREAWRTVRIAGTRYVVMPSGRSEHVYQVRFDARGCSCPWYSRTARRCSHMLALELAAQQPLRHAVAA
jgi:hypothetical protein